MKTIDSSSPSRTYHRSNNALKGIIVIGILWSIAGMTAALFSHDTSLLVFFAALTLCYCISFLLYRNDHFLTSTIAALILSLCAAAGSLTAGMTDQSIALMVFPAVLFYAAVQFPAKAFLLFSGGVILMLNILMIVPLFPLTIIAFSTEMLAVMNLVLLSISATGRLLCRDLQPIPNTNPVLTQTMPARPYKGSIIIVDDNKSILEILTKSLTAEGYKIFPFSSVMEVTRWMEDPPESFDLLITDYFLNESDGRIVIELARKVLPTVPIILISGYPLNKLSFDAEYYRNVEFMQKPFTAQDVIGTIERMFR